MSIPTNREEFAERIKQNLGSPVIVINVTDTQIDNCIDSALYEFYRKHYDAIEAVYAIITPDEASIAQGYITLPEDIIGVSEVFRMNNVGNIWSIDYQFQLAELYSLSNVMRFGGISYFYTQRMHLDLMNNLFAPERQFNYNEVTHNLIIAGGLKDLANTEGSLVARVFRKVIGDGEEGAETNYKAANIWKVQWLIDYATALVKLQWGQNMSKYQNIQLLGGVTMNGGEMKAEAKQEINDLKQELDDEYSLPIDFFVA